MIKMFIFYTITVSATKKCSDRTMNCMHQGSHCKNKKSTNTGNKKLLPGMLQKLYECWEKYATVLENYSEVDFIVVV
jgi:hypothetical protein